MVVEVRVGDRQRIRVQSRRNKDRAMVVWLRDHAMAHSRDPEASSRRAQSALP